MSDITITKGKLANVLSSDYPRWLEERRKNRRKGDGGVSPYGYASEFIDEYLSGSDRGSEDA